MRVGPYGGGIALRRDTVSVADHRVKSEPGGRHERPAFSNVDRSMLAGAMAR